MSRYLIGDCHLGHKNIANFRKLKKAGSDELYTSEEQHELMYEGLAQVGKRDTLFLMGDIAFDKYWLDRVKELPCRNKILILGNHDLDRKTVTISEIVETYDKVYSLHRYKGFWMTHCPMHPMELRGRLNIHGHTHPQLMLAEDGIPDQRYISVCAEYTNYKPISWEKATSGDYYHECWAKFTDMLNHTSASATRED